MSDEIQHQPGRRFWGVFILVLGAFIAAAALGLVRVDESSFHAPRWVVFLAGVAFATVGLILVVPDHWPVREALAAVILLSMSAIGAWVSLFAPSEGFSGGIPFVPYELNVALARALFGVGAFITFAFAVVTIRRAWRIDA